MVDKNIKTLLFSD